jgi:hypothetical protein
MFKKNLIAAAVASAMCISMPVMAETDAERVERLEKEIQALKDAYLGGTPQRVKKIAEREKEVSWFDKIEVGALIEAEAGYVSPYEGDSESDIVVATFAPYIISDVNDWIGVEGALLYEEDDTDLEVDIATVSIANPEKTPFYSIIGQTYMPFGVYETNMVSDPLTLEIGETRETAIQVGAATGGFNVNVYTYNGDVDKDGKEKINSYGAAIDYGMETDSVAFAIGASYTNNLGDSDALQEGVVVGNDRVPGYSAYGIVEFAGFNLIGEYLAASKEFDSADYGFDGRGAKPNAYNVELGYGFATAGKDSTIAIGYQASDEAIDLELPKSAILVAYSVDLMTNTSLAFEYAALKDYDESDTGTLVANGTGKSGSSFVAQLAVVF